jgi:hypothetical protein
VNSRPRSADRANTTRAPRPLIENAGARDYEPGDFMVAMIPTPGNQRCIANEEYWHLVGTTIDDGVIALVYLRTGAK